MFMFCLLRKNAKRDFGRPESRNLAHSPSLPPRQRYKAKAGCAGSISPELHRTLSASVWQSLGGGRVSPALTVTTCTRFLCFSKQNQQPRGLFFFSSQKVYLTIWHSFFPWIKAVFICLSWKSLKWRKFPETPCIFVDCQTKKMALWSHEKSYFLLLHT